MAGSYYGRYSHPPPIQPPPIHRSYASQYREHDALFNAYEHLQHLPRGETALTMLRKVGSLVKPIMRKRGWKVGTLAEFLPPEANLLGLNIDRGAKICLRLRYHNYPDLFLPVEQVVDTMLHELAHNLHGPHDAVFQRLWDDLRDEHDLLVSKGFTGEGFLSEGKRLGGHPVPPHSEMRRMARASAERRQVAAQGTLSSGGGHRLGGQALHRTTSDFRGMIARQAILRNPSNRLSKSSKNPNTKSNEITGCASNRTDAAVLSAQSASNSFRTQAEEDDANDRAIAQALYDLIEEEEERKLLQGTWSSPPTEGGLAWHPVNGLYDPRVERPNVEAGGGIGGEESEQMRWAVEESLRLEKKKELELERTRQGSNRSAPPVIPWGSKPPRPPSTSGPSHPDSSTSALPLKSQPNPKTQNKIPRKPTNPPKPTNQNKPIEISDEIHEIIDLSEPFDPTAVRRHPAAPPPTSYPNRRDWACETCTCINPASFLACQACGMPRRDKIVDNSGGGAGGAGIKKMGNSANQALYSTSTSTSTSDSLGWICRCGAFMEHRWWTCSACGMMKESS